MPIRERSTSTTSTAGTAREMGVKLADLDRRAFDAGLAVMRFGVDQARRGWIEAGDVLNTRSWAELSKLLAR